MPWIVINVLEGHSVEKKKRLHQDVTAAVSRALEIPADWVRIQLIEMKQEDHSIGGVPMTEFGK